MGEGSMARELVPGRPGFDLTAKVVLYGLFVLLGAALTTPWLFLGLRFVVGADHAWAEVPITRVFDRAALVFGVIGAVPFVRSFGIGRCADLGVEVTRGTLREWGVGLGISIGSVGLAAGTLLALGWFSVSSPFRWGQLGVALGTAVAVSLIEEPLFRGVLLGTFRRRLGTIGAVVWTSVIFALVHFTKPRHVSLGAEEIGFATGFELLPHVFHRFSEPWLLLGGFATLWVFGAILAGVTLHTGRLALALALHGGWVFAVRGFKLTSDRLEPTGIILARSLRVGVAPLILLLVTGMVLWYIVPRLFPSRELKPNGTGSNHPDDIASDDGGAGVQADESG